MNGATLVFAAVVGARFLLPLAIPRFPLPAIIACLILDGIDQTIFQTFGYDPPGYQSYDKAMDVYYLAIAYLATMRNWASMPAFGISRFLYFYRLVGVEAFELTHVRAVLLIFPNTFEYFFIAYEAVRSRWSPVRFVFKWWLTAAAFIWIFIKLPQEYWLHVAQLDVTDTLRDYWWALPLLIVLIGILAAVLWFVVRPRLRDPDWSWRIPADALPAEMDTAAEQTAWRAEHGAVLSWVTLEKVVLVGLLSVIFAKTLPGISATSLRMFVTVGVVVFVNAAITLVTARRSWSIESLTATFAVRTVANVLLVVLADWLLGSGSGDVDFSHTLFVLMLISLITTLHDRWQPVNAYRMATASTAEPQSAA